MTDDYEMSVAPCPACRSAHPEAIEWRSVASGDRLEVCGRCSALWVLAKAEMGEVEARAFMLAWRKEQQDGTK